MKKEEFTDAAILVGQEENEENCFRLETLTLSSKRSPKSLLKLRKKHADKYEGKAGKKYAVLFYSIDENKHVKITDFFRAILVDPKFYVKNLLINSGTLAIAADEFMLNEVWKSSARKGTDSGIYKRCVEMLSLFWIKDDLTSQCSKEYYEKHVRK